MRDYISITADTKYLYFEVSGSSDTTLLVERRGGGCSKSIKPFVSRGGKASFHVEEPGFGLPPGWYLLTVYENCCECGSYVARIHDDCRVKYMGKDELMYDVEDFCKDA